MASAPPSSQAAAALSLASSLGLSLRADWLEAARAATTAGAGAAGGNWSSSAPMTAEALVSLVLNADLNSAGAGESLPADLESLHGRPLAGRRILQVDEVVNAAASAKHRYTGAPLSGRMLKLLLTDGSRHVVAFEMEPVPALSADLPAGCKIAITDPLVLRGMLALRPANVAVLGGRVARLEAARARARAAWDEPPDGRRRRGGGGGGGGDGGGAPGLYEKARAAAWPGGSAAVAGASAAAAAAAVAPAAPAAPPAAPAPPPPPPPPAQQIQQQEQQQQQENHPPPAAAVAPPPPAAVILLDSSDDEDAKMEAAPDGGGGAGEERQQQQQQQQQQQPASPPPPSFFPLPAAAGPPPTSWPRRSLSEAAAAAAATAAAATTAATATAATTTSPAAACLVRGRVAQATSALRFVDPQTWEALPEFGLDVELEESAEAGSGGSGAGGSEEEEGFVTLARRPASLSHAVISGLLGGISTHDLTDQYAREGREAVLSKMGAVKAFFASFDGWLGVEARGGGAAEATAAAVKRESEGGGGGGGGSSTETPPAAAASSPSLVVVGWWEA